MDVAPGTVSADADDQKRECPCGGLAGLGAKERMRRRQQKQERGSVSDRVTDRKGSHGCCCLQKTEWMFWMESNFVITRFAITVASHTKCDQ
uniref:Uncharacterized protein n=1 Tax=Oryza sativa subsp. japonica TaxID=39947 RepID=Q6YUR9_ORYSJ|nr:hypothetical protein [Oryza sativa Japonica Group]BAD08138.1 hypothetical protein [Oryza sativa Japonica Group]